MAKCSVRNYRQASAGGNGSEPDDGGTKQDSCIPAVSGGGAVYHDLGNINLTFIETTRLARFETYLERTVEMLTAAGVAVRGDERLGIYVDGRKVSGSAQCVHRNRAMYHCTLLYDTNLVLLNKLLEVEGLEEKVAVHPAVRSVRSEVTNLKEYMHPALSTDKFREWVFRYFAGPSVAEAFSKEELAIIEGLRENKYNTICN